MRFDWLVDANDTLADAKVRLVLADVGRRVIVIVAAPRRRRETVEVLQPQI